MQGGSGCIHPGVCGTCLRLQHPTPYNTGFLLFLPSLECVTATTWQTDVTSLAAEYLWIMERLRHWFSSDYLKCWKGNMKFCWFDEAFIQENIQLKKDCDNIEPSSRHKSGYYGFNHIEKVLITFYSVPYININNMLPNKNKNNQRCPFISTAIFFSRGHARGHP